MASKLTHRYIQSGSPLRPGSNLSLSPNNHNTKSNDNSSSNGGQSTKRKRMRNQNIRKRRGAEEPFWLTNVKVGGILASVCVLLYSLYNIRYFYNRLFFISNSSSSKNANDADALWEKYVDGGTDSHLKVKQVNGQKSKVFPHFDHNDLNDQGERFHQDAFTIANLLFSSLSSNHNHGQGHETSKNHHDHSNYLDFIQTASDLRNSFADLYGGENSAREILRRGLLTFHANFNESDNSSTTTTTTTTSTSIKDKISSSILYTAQRMIRAKQQNKPFKISFAGSSAVSGRGNYFDQTFPFILAGILTDPLKTIDINLEVYNAAIADISSFPYGWCLRNFLGSDADAISWDVGMSSRHDMRQNLAFEAYLRNSLTMDHEPMMIVRENTDTLKIRSELLQKYVDLGVIHDPILIDIQSAIEPFTNLIDDIIPQGLKHLDEFGGPDGGPDQTKTNLSLQQHELIGWIISMYFLAAAEVATAYFMRIPKTQNLFDDISIPYRSSYHKGLVSLPSPQSTTADADAIRYASSLLFGIPVEYSNEEKSAVLWTMNSIYCKTSFDPIISGSLEDVVISEIFADSIDLLLPKGPIQFTQGWILDVGKSSKQDMTNLQQYDFDYQDTKKAYFGTSSSGTISFFLPYDDDETISTKTQSNLIKQLKSSGPNLKDDVGLYRSIAICEVSETRSGKECNMEKDIEYIIGGVNADARYISDATGASYLGKQACVVLNVPSNATLTTRHDMINSLYDAAIEKDKDEDGAEKEEKRKKLLKKYEDSVGLSLTLRVKKYIFWKDGPCSVSHVIWEKDSNDI